MKTLFLLVCILCAVSFSAVSVIVATGRIPFQPPEVEVVEVEQIAVTESLSVFPSERRIVDELIEALKQERLSYEKSSAGLKTRSLELDHEQTILNELKTSLEALQSKLDTSIVRAEASEVVNLKKLANFYSKMAPESAADLLKAMDSERAATIISMISDRQAAAILDAASAGGPEATRKVVEWSDCIRRKDNTKTERKRT